MTAMFDEWVKAFLGRHPAGTIIEIGAGLNTRFERLDNGVSKWFEIDLPDAMQVRQAFFHDHERRKLIAASIVDDAWIAAARAAPAPHFIVIEAVLMYLDEVVVKEAVARIARSFPGAHVALDLAGTWMIENQLRQRAIRNIRARFHWSCDEPRDIERWGFGLALLESRTLADVPDPLRRRVPWLYLLAARTLLRRRVNSYRLALFKVSEASRRPVREGVSS